MFSRKINLKSIDKDITISESEEKLINDYSENLENHDLAIFWQLTLKTIEDLKIVMNEKLLLEMLIIQMVHLKGFNLKNNLNENLDKAETIESMNVKRVDQDDNPGMRNKSVEDRSSAQDFWNIKKSVQYIFLSTREAC